MIDRLQLLVGGLVLLAFGLALLALLLRSL